ncbi:hypothetical protein FPANT_12297 [Fusarium pseudoanthophilum]|uniref:Uncharacterized protein n=1 Tax=Fusarium pseudoanthophilum TaxID=48495 RepID=A0A8H5KJI9_9HYPO|nr:hypothetical protein FPANT_12297 [Fusarium pseudoanthophilum]
MNSIDDVRRGIERLDSFSKDLAEAKQSFHDMDDSDYSVAQRDRLDELYQQGGGVFKLLGPWTDDIWDWRNLTVRLAQCYLDFLQKELWDLMPADHPKKFFVPESSVLRLIADCENTILRSFLRWAIVGAHNPSSAVHSLLQMHFSDDAVEYMVPKPKPEDEMKVVLVRVIDLPKLLDHWDQRVVSGPGEEEMVEVCKSNKSDFLKPNFRKSVTKGLFVLAWKSPGDFEDMWMDGQGFAIPDVPGLI